MADSSISVNIAGAATAPVDAFTQSNGDFRQAVVIGDAAAASTTAVDTAGRLSVRTGASTNGVAIGVPLPATTSTTLLATNAARLFASIYNPLSADLLVALAATANTSAYTVIVPANGYYEIPAVYTGPVAGYTTGVGTVLTTVVS
jgi:hypothetical protein